MERVGKSIDERKDISQVIHVDAELDSVISKWKEQPCQTCVSNRCCASLGAAAALLPGFSSCQTEVHTALGFILYC